MAGSFGPASAGSAGNGEDLYDLLKIDCGPPPSENILERDVLPSPTNTEESAKLTSF